MPRMKCSVKISFERQSNYKKKGDKNDRCPKGTATAETSKVQENRILTKQNETGMKKRKFYIQSSISKKQLTF